MIDGTANIVQTKKFIKAGEGGIRKVKTQKKKKVLDTERRNGWLASRQNPYSNCFSDARWCDAMHPSYIFFKRSCCSTFTYWGKIPNKKGLIFWIQLNTGWPNRLGMKLVDVILHQFCYWAKVSIVKCSWKVELTVASIFYTRSSKRVKV